MNVKQAADRAGVLPRQIQKAIKGGVLKATLNTDKLPAGWEITQADFDTWQANRRGRGRPKKE